MHFALSRHIQIVAKHSAGVHMASAQLALGPRLIAALNERFRSASAEAVMTWAITNYPNKVALSCSFGGPTGMVLLDIGLKIDRNLSVLYVDTEFLFPETYATVQAVKERYGIEPLAFRPAMSPSVQDRVLGPVLWERDADRCCDMRKVQPMRDALSHFDAYFTGLRRDQASSRSETPRFQWDAKFGLLKINPLVDWTESQTWTHILDNKLPYNVLNDHGYPSVGCTHCTRPIAAGEDARAGRWSGSDKIECGLHTA